MMPTPESSLPDTAPPKRYTAPGLAVAVSLCILILILLHRQWIFSPGAVYLNSSPEGVSQYINTAWHVQCDTTATHFGGQNYPFGEHIFFTENMSLLSSSMQFVHRRIFPLTGRTAGMLNVFLLLSTVWGVIFLYLVFDRLHMPAWVSVWASLAIAFLSPQHAHLQAQIGLATVFVMPLLLWLLILFENSLTRRYISLAIGAVVWASAQISGFYYWLAALFLMGYVLLHWLRGPNWRRMYLRALHLVAMLLLPYVLLNLWLHWSDFAIDRPKEMEAFWLNRNTIAGLFLPPDFAKHTGALPQSYLGLTAGLFTLLLAVRLFRPFPKKWEADFMHRINAPFLYACLFSGFVLTLLSVDLPALPGFAWLWDFTGPFRGLRHPAHLAWAYFYVANIMGIYWCWMAAAHLPKKWAFWRLPLTMLPLLLLSEEAYLWQQWTKVQPIPNVELHSRIEAPTEGDPFQATLWLPYCHASPADTSVQPDVALYSTMRGLGLHNRLPDMGVYQFKPSSAQMLQLLQLSLAPCDFTSLLNELPNENPILLVFETARTAEWQKAAPHLLRNARPLRTDSMLTYFSLLPDSIRSAIQYEQYLLDKEWAALPKNKTGGWYSAAKEPPVAYESFNSLKGGRSFQGGGAAQGRLNKPLTLWEGKLDAGVYMVSFWIYGNYDQDLKHHLAVKDAEKKLSEYSLRPFVKAIVNDWALIEIPLNIGAQGAYRELTLYRPDTRLPFEVDELLIRKSGKNYYREIRGWLVKNNYWYRRF